ncbi:MAG TPA: hypothetical protein VFL12_09585, partial [Thermoanaerobaculia bacterium]|nr:hypothetical protein [Thermoanaerobaculia bacterium]
QRRLQAHGIFFNFAIDYLARHPDVSRSFTVDDAVRDDLFRFLESQEIEKSGTARAEYAADAGRNRIDAQIETEVLSSKFGPDEGWKRGLRTDLQVERALASFPEAERLAAGKARPISHT